MTNPEARSEGERGQVWEKVAPSARPRDSKILMGASHFWLLRDSSGAIAEMFWNEADVDLVLAALKAVDRHRRRREDV